METITPAMQEYLAEIYRIASYQSDPYVSTSVLADRLKRSAPAIVRMASRLREEGCIEHELYRGIRLTPQGEAQALLNIRRHRIVEVFMVKVMGFGWEEIHDEADALARNVSEAVLARMEAMTNYPRRCPHGEPIPSADGHIIIPRDFPLVELEPICELTISRVNTHDAEKLSYLNQIHLTPGQEIDLLARQPFNGPLRLRIGRDEQVIGAELAGALRVSYRAEYQP
ncbi:MAG: metal-dependent transcriptional regulator [Anaerolineae bacterium]|nr:metal-dependent transcriptional regulator [Anaerolineae bacterium]